MAIAHAVFDLCARAEYVDALRLEAQTALAQDNGEWQLATIKKLHRLDSFLKESQRINHSTFREQIPVTSHPVPRRPRTDHSLQSDSTARS